MEPTPGTCVLCLDSDGVVVWQTPELRVVRVRNDDVPAYYRLVTAAHVREMSELSGSERRELLDALLAIEQVLLDSLNPTTINIAKFGNVVRHLHWHVMARFEWDAYFPEPIWGLRKRPVQPPALERLVVSLDRLDELVAAKLRVTLQGGAA